jgi:hypothetical protein
MTAMDQDDNPPVPDRPVGQPTAKVTVHEVITRKGYVLMTSAWTDDRVFVGSREWRAANPMLWRALLKQSKQLAALQNRYQR